MSGTDASIIGMSIIGFVFFVVLAHLRIDRLQERITALEARK